MITIRAFYKSYQLHHHRTKTVLLRKLLDDDTGFFKAEEVVDSTWGYTGEDYRRSLRIEMRANLFHAIETLFTLYFCLQPDKNGVVNDAGLFQNLNKRNFYYNGIKKIAENPEESLKILDQIVKFGDLEMKFGQYLFYYGAKPEKLAGHLETSLEAIKHALHLLAIELNDTTEYNSYKHALRSVPAILEFAFVKPDTMEVITAFDTKDSMTYFQELKENGFSYVTKVFDSERDHRMTLLASNLIYNIIMFRRACIVKDLPLMAAGFFSKESVDQCAIHSTDSYKFTNSFKPVVDSQKK
ncbi:MAG TPA: hypothetical protein VK588_02205 [Chitinophagaceae bacterium]|nr:hypothetical protein [Chitinophagaceae bacterium]